MRQHGLFCPTTSGPFSPGHFLPIYANWSISKVTGGTFIVLVEDELSMLQRGNLRNPIGDRDPDDLRPAADYWAEHMITDLHSLGMGPSTDEELRAQGMDWDGGEHDGMGVRYQSENMLTQHYYRLMGLEEDFGPWPMVYPKDMFSNLDAVYIYGPNRAAPVIHPYLILNWVVEEMSTGRTFAIDGDDLTHMMGQYTECAHRLRRRTGWTIPSHYFIPSLYWQREGINPRSTPKGQPYAVERLSATHGAGGDGLLLREAIDAGIDRETLLAYLLDVAIKPEAHELWMQESSTGGAIPAVEPAILTTFKDDAVLDEIDWHRFCKTGQVKAPKKQRGKR